MGPASAEAALAAVAVAASAAQQPLNQYNKNTPNIYIYIKTRKISNHIRILFPIVR